MAVDYTFPTNTNPESSFWDSEITSVTSDGSKWVFPSGGSGYKIIKTTYRFNANDSIEAVVDMQFPSTSAGTNGFGLWGGASSYFEVGYNWNFNQGYLNASSPTGRINTGIGSDVRFTAKIIIEKDGSGKIYVNDTLYKSDPAGTFSGKTFQLYSQKYTESAGYIYSGYVKSPISSEANFTTFFNQYL